MLNNPKEHLVDDLKDFNYKTFAVENLNNTRS